tara:strand:- start:3007 stop:4068 length:1062 start_codon:yes stop_codon:yes gene_type:complete
MLFKNFNNLENPYLNKQRKIHFFEKAINALTMHHYKKSKNYKKIIDFMEYQLTNIKLDKIPFLPTKIFKDHDLMSIPKEKIHRVLTSSGTSGNLPSRIYLDKENSQNQTKVLSQIVQNFLGKKRLPMLVIDQNPNLLNRSTFNARMAAIYGFSIFGKNLTYLLDENHKINYLLLNNFLKKYGKNKFFLFGFTSFVFDNLINKLSKKLCKNTFENGILLHGGGWKKMEKIKINNDEFKKKLFKKLKLKEIYNYYGLVEQTGSIFIECKYCNCFVTSNFSEILIRDTNFNVLKSGKKGFIQLLSLLPRSYPGHSIITEDIGEIVDNKTCKCSIKGTRFIVHGRAKHSETRGCSDV